MKNTILVFTLLIGISSCVKNPLSISFDGITRTDNYGVVLSNDPTDWTFDDTWRQKEADLFTSSYKKGCAPAGNNKIIAYPNPCSGVFQLSVQMPAAGRLELRLVDKNFRVLASSDSISNQTIGLQVGNGVKGTVRLYYKLIDGDCEYRGHGDILVQ